MSTLCAFNWDGIGSLGVNLKQLHRAYEPNAFTQNALNSVDVGSGAPDPLFSRHGYSKTAYAADVGALIRFGPTQKLSRRLNAAKHQPARCVVGQ
jgi:hypothetical protein